MFITILRVVFILISIILILFLTNQPIFKNPKENKDKRQFKIFSFLIIICSAYLGLEFYELIKNIFLK